MDATEDDAVTRQAIPIEADSLRLLMQAVTSGWWLNSFSGLARSPTLLVCSDLVKVPLESFAAVTDLVVEVSSAHNNHATSLCTGYLKESRLCVLV